MYWQVAAHSDPISIEQQSTSWFAIIIIIAKRIKDKKNQGQKENIKNKKKSKNKKNQRPRENERQPKARRILQAGEQDYQPVETELG